MRPDTTLQDLANAMRGWAETLFPTAWPTAAAELRHLIAHGHEPPLGDAPVRPVTAPAIAALHHHLPALLAAPTAAPAVAAALAATWHRLDWHYSYPDHRDLEAGIAFADVIGPGGPLRADTMRAGFTFLAPAVLYPAHAHPARELYVVLSGRAQWTRSGVTALQSPGDMIFHASDEPHAMQSAAAPLLAMYVWSGEIEVSPRYV